MNKETFIQAYVGIEIKCVLRKENNRKIDGLISLFQESNTAFTLEDIIDITKELLNKEVTIRFPLFKNLLYSNLSEGVESDNIEAIKLLIRLNQHLISYESYTKEYKYSSLFLIIKGLNISPDDKQLLEMYEQDRKNYIRHTLHELPSGVLYGMDGASIEECSELLEVANEYEKVCGKLKLDRSELIQECKFYYAGYKDYLIMRENYKNFKEYLVLKQLSPNINP